MLEVVEDEGSLAPPGVRGDNSVADRVDNISTLWFISWVKSVSENERPLVDCPNREKKVKVSLVHEMANRWRTMFNIVFCLRF